MFVLLFSRKLLSREDHRDALQLREGDTLVHHDAHARELLLAKNEGTLAGTPADRQTDTLRVGASEEVEKGKARQEQSLSAPAR